MSQKRNLPPAPPPEKLQSKHERENIHDMFAMFNAVYFDNSLEGVFVEYSVRMTLCAGTCTFLGTSGGCRIALSEPILTRRPLADTQDTLLHEMIHASLFLKYGTRVRDGPDGHGPKFLSEAARINAAAGSNITVYHTFRDEVDASRVHWWKCQGRCGRVIKRAMNRAPGPTDIWWKNHATECSGLFEKTHEPPPKASPAKYGVLAVSADGESVNEQLHNVIRVRRIDDFLHREAELHSISKYRKAEPTQVGKRSPRSDVQSNQHKNNTIQTLNDFVAPYWRVPATAPLQHKSVLSSVTCPVCSETVSDEQALNAHLDICLRGDFSPPPQPINRYTELARSGPETSVELVKERNESAGASSLKKLNSLASSTATASQQIITNKVRTNSRTKSHKNDDVIHENKKVTCNNSSVDEINETAERNVCKDLDSGILKSRPKEEIVDGNDSPIRTRAHQWSKLLSSDIARRFALGLDDTYGPLDINMKHTAAELKSRNKEENEFVLPHVRQPIWKQPNRVVAEVLKKQLQIWDPNGNDEPLFASGAARLGVTHDDFMKILRATGSFKGPTFHIKEAHKLFQVESPRVTPSSPKENIGGVLEEQAGASIPTSLQQQHPSVSKSSRSNPAMSLGANMRSDRYAAHPLASDQRPKSSHPKQICDYFVPISRAGNEGGEHATLSTDPVTEVTKCPMCEVAVRRVDIDSHLQECLGDTDSQPGYEENSEQTTLRASLPQQNNLPNRDGQSNVIAGKDGKHSNEKQNSVNNAPHCPICDRSVSRDELESHTAECITRTGLAHEFG